MHGFYHPPEAEYPSFWLSTVFTRALTAVENVRLASQVTRWEAAMGPGFAPTVNPTPVTPTLSVLWSEMAALAVS